MHDGARNNRLDALETCWQSLVSAFRAKVPGVEGSAHRQQAGAGESLSGLIRISSVHDLVKWGFKK